ncbi:MULTISPECIES: hypothetical protein [unclassified Mucilaginibacter]|uniref:hypothetical protein n=1 Tax=unclassified Mucilaginibacter TaxID=2617802 RepID=UPI0031F71ED8
MDKPIQHLKGNPFLKRHDKLRYKGYKAACEKYQKEIASIQQYLPDWKPTFK